ncbi:hypothetical protein BD410DRAFT_802960 [Rickenella mellea]|uniref:Uncharacterized protein n=1 Tax=Rickenella mellea TaxID=50990 RepID=A0A4Y7Q7T1_9AGAM|nr:hypothetical protein BD410DRAFT_802960 [Rickenella mellea]
MDRLHKLVMQLFYRLSPDTKPNVQPVGAVPNVAPLLRRTRTASQNGSWFVSRPQPPPSLCSVVSPSSVWVSRAGCEVIGVLGRRASTQSRACNTSRAMKDHDGHSETRSRAPVHSQLLRRSCTALVSNRTARRHSRSPPTLSALCASLVIARSVSTDTPTPAVDAYTVPPTFQRGTRARAMRPVTRRLRIKREERRRSTHRYRERYQARSCASWPQITPHKLPGHTVTPSPDQTADGREQNEASHSNTRTCHKVREEL